MKWKMPRFLLYGGFIVVCLSLAFLVLYLIEGQFWLLPNSPSTYYKIFNKSEIFQGNENTATQADQKLDIRLQKYHRLFERMTGINHDEQLLKALFYMNYVKMSSYYGPRNLTETDFKTIFWASDYNQCGNYALILAMLLDKAGYTFRTVSINSGGHGIDEVKIGDQWMILDPTTNLWFNKSTEEILNGESYTVKSFVVHADDPNNYKARLYFDDVKVNILELRDMMLGLGRDFKPKIDKYNYIDLTKYQY